MQFHCSEQMLVPHLSGTGCHHLFIATTEAVLISICVLSTLGLHLLIPALQTSCAGQEKAFEGQPFPLHQGHWHSHYLLQNRTPDSALSSLLVL